MQNFSAILILLTLSVSSKADFCQENFTINELPAGLIDEATHIFAYITQGNNIQCPEQTWPETDVKFWYFNKTLQKGLLVYPPNTQHIVPKEKTIFLVHGWLCNVTNDRVPEIKNAYLEKYDANVIGIEWTARSVDLYVNSFCSIPKVAEIVGEFLCNTPQIDPEKVHFVGHSMGAQISGLTGQEVQRQCNKKLARITGLDPAGPLYQGLDESKRLDKSDAQFVDVIHTNMYWLGYTGNTGTVDFYPNCGAHQPGCMDGKQFLQSLNPLDYPLEIAGCNHLRSTDLMIDSIRNGKLIGTSAVVSTFIPFIPTCLKHVRGKRTSQMGQNVSLEASGSYILYTNSRAPFSQEWS